MRFPWAEPVRLELEGLWLEEGRLEPVEGLVELDEGRLEDEGR